MQIDWTFKPFKELSTDELYKILYLRNEVFIIEQNCIYQDVDGRDQDSWHLCAWEEEKLLAYCRCFSSGVSDEAYAKIGRVVSSPEARGTGLGRLLMEKAITLTLKTFKTQTIKISAQEYLKTFYESLGFVQSGPGYPEDGIPHIPMLYKK